MVERSYINQRRRRAVGVPMSRTGTVLGNVTVLKEVTSPGGFGAVYEGIRRLGTVEARVAVKFFHFSSPHKQQLFLQERNILARLKHPNIARFYDAGKAEDGAPYMVMEYVDGKPLTTYCDENQLSVDQRLELFTKVCDAVACAHSHTVIHLDLKPDNILVRDDGTVKLLDFGIAKFFDETPAAMLPHPQLNPPLTLQYASPEQYSGNRLNVASDIYSLGVILYELLTGVLPLQSERYEREHWRNVVLNHQPRKPSELAFGGITTARRLRPKQLKRKLRGELDAIALKALCKSAAERYKSVEEFRENLQLFLEGAPVRIRPNTRRYRARKWVAKQKALSVTLAISGLLFVAAGCLSLYYSVGADRAQARGREFERIADLLPKRISDLEMSLVNVPDSQTARRELLAAGLALTQALDQEQDLGSLQRPLIEGLLLIAKMQRRQGDLSGALATVSRSIDRARTLSQRVPPTGLYADTSRYLETKEVSDSLLDGLAMRRDILLALDRGDEARRDELESAGLKGAAHE